MGVKEQDGVAEAGRNVGGLDFCQLACERGCQRKGERKVVLPKVDETPGHSTARTEQGVAAWGKSNDFASDAVFLCSELEVTEDGIEESVVGTSADVEGVVLRSKEDHIHSAKWGSIGARARILARAPKEKECQTNHVVNAL